MKLMVSSKGFEQHTANAFSQLHKNADSSDVTLVTDDLTRLPVHRLILSVSSPFFCLIAPGETTWTRPALPWRIQQRSAPSTHFLHLPWQSGSGGAAYEAIHKDAQGL